MKKCKKYPPEIENKMKIYFESLGEKGKRHYCALEAEKLSYGGQSYISRLFGVSRNRIQKGIMELSDEKMLQEIPIGKERRKGGGRKKKKLVAQIK